MEQETMAMNGSDDPSAPDADDNASATAAGNEGAANAAQGVGAAVGPGMPVDENTADSDARSIYVGNVSTVLRFPFLSQRPF